MIQDAKNTLDMGQRCKIFSNANIELAEVEKTKKHKAIYRELFKMEKN